MLRSTPLTALVPHARTDPVVASDGNTYERSALVDMFATGNTRSPLTNEPLAHTHVVVNQAVKRMCDAYREKHATGGGDHKRARFTSTTPTSESLAHIFDQAQSGPGPSS